MFGACCNKASWLTAFITTAATSAHTYIHAPRFHCLVQQHFCSCKSRSLLTFPAQIFFFSCPAGSEIQDSFADIVRSELSHAALRPLFPSPPHKKAPAMLFTLEMKVSYALVRTQLPCASLSAMQEKMNRYFQYVLDLVVFLAFPIHTDSCRCIFPCQNIFGCCFSWK